jgi:hypothetical protein
VPDSAQSSDGVITKPSGNSVAQTIDGLRRLMADRGFTVFNVWALADAGFDARQHPRLVNPVTYRDRSPSQ